MCVCQGAWVKEKQGHFYGFKFLLVCWFAVYPGYTATEMREENNKIDKAQSCACPIRHVLKSFCLPVSFLKLLWAFRQLLLLGPFFDSLTYL